MLGRPARGRGSVRPQHPHDPNPVVGMPGELYVTLADGTKVDPFATPVGGLGETWLRPPGNVPPTPPRPDFRHEEGTRASRLDGYRRDMDEARAVLARIERIERLDRLGTPAQVMLDEVRSLLLEAEVWVRVEAGDTSRAEGALERCRDAVFGARSSANARAGLW